MKRPEGSTSYRSSAMHRAVSPYRYHEERTTVRLIRCREGERGPNRLICDAFLLIFLPFLACRRNFHLQHICSRRGTLEPLSTLHDRSNSTFYYHAKLYSRTTVHYKARRNLAPLADTLQVFPSAQPTYFVVRVGAQLVTAQCKITQLEKLSAAASDTQRAASSTAFKDDATARRWNA